MNRALSLLMLAALLGTSVAARAAAPPPAKTTPEAADVAAEPGEFPDAVTSHTLAIDGRTIAYTARAGTIVLKDQDGTTTARVFYTAYTVDGANPLTQPVTFIYNGGPGSSTMWLRMGSFGPVRVHAADASASGPPPYSITDNPYSLLDKRDLVFIDMPDSGFGRIVAGKEKEFFGVDQDVAAFGQFVSNYSGKFGRWNCRGLWFAHRGTWQDGRGGAMADAGLAATGRSCRAVRAGWADSTGLPRPHPAVL